MTYRSAKIESYKSSKSHIGRQDDAWAQHAASANAAVCPYNYGRMNQSSELSPARQKAGDNPLPGYGFANSTNVPVRFGRRELRGISQDPDGHIEAI
jgi:hypothetical protein